MSQHIKHWEQNNTHEVPLHREIQLTCHDHRGNYSVKKLWIMQQCKIISILTASHMFHCLHKKNYI